MERNVPKLRFKGFNDEWKNTKLGDISNIIMGQSPSSDQYNEKFEGMPLVQGNADIRQRKTSPRMYTTEVTKACKIGDIIMSVRAPVGSIGRATEKCCIGRGVCAINTCEKQEFLYQVLLQQEDKWGKVSQGSTFESINRNDIANLRIKLPSLQEQERIANFLTKVDKIIEKQDEKVKNLENYKKGMMQKIFSQEIRFKDENGEAYPEWDKRRIGDYIIEYTEKTTINNQYPVLTSSREGLMLQSDYFKDRQVTTDDNIGYFVLPYGYITFRSRSDDGIFVFNENKIIEKGIVSYFYPVFTFKNQLNNYYGITYMNNYLKKDILKEIVGTSQLVLSINKLKNLKILYPCIEEQNKIANFLSKIDLIIDKEKDNLKQLKQWKKGLLQQMFV